MLNWVTSKFEDFYFYLCIHCFLVNQAVVFPTCLCLIVVEKEMHSCSVVHSSQLKLEISISKYRIKKKKSQYLLCPFFVVVEYSKYNNSFMLFFSFYKPKTANGFIISLFILVTSFANFMNESKVNSNKSFQKLCTITTQGGNTFFCFRIEESSSMGSKRSPQFFQIYTILISNRLKIPKGFMKHFKGVSSGSACTLKGPSGRVWKVSLTKDVGAAGLFLGEGWPVFVKDHFIEMGDFLVFRYDGSLDFQVKIYGKTACPKESAFEAICDQVTSTVTTNGKKKANQAKHNRWDFVPMEEAVAEAAGRRGGLLSQRRNVTINEIEKAKEAADKFTSTNPFFTIVMRASHVYFGFSVTIPSSFWRDHLPKCSEEMTLWDPRGRAWSVRYHFIRKIRVVLSKGWVAFSEHNNIEADDVCVFELVQQNQMKVHIFRVVEETRPLIKNSRDFREGNLLGA